MRCDGRGQNKCGAAPKVKNLGARNSATQCRLLVWLFVIAEHFDVLSSDNAEIHIATRPEVIKDSGPNSILHQQFGRHFVQILTVTCAGQERDYTSRRQLVKNQI